MFLKDCKIISNVNVALNYFILTVENREAVEKVRAGQFFMLKCKNEATFLRRPISLHNCDPLNGTLEFLYEVKGKGTLEFSKLSLDETINIQGPLGNGFNVEEKNKNIAIVGGGMGMAPLKLLIKNLNLNNNVKLFLGVHSKEYINVLKSFETVIEKENIHIASDDGSIGVKGNVVAIFKEELERNKFDKIYSCGPEKMLEALHEVAVNNNILLDISLEERMACGVKACVGCSIKTKEGMKKICYDGPVFSSSKIIELHPKEKVENSCCN